jgi:hypothetical protein
VKEKIKEWKEYRKERNNETENNRLKERNK